jgi:diphthamide synthase (EF-2-diphthine--ammonia ligase)
MWKVIANFVWQFLSMESVRKFIMDGLKRLVASTDNGIDDKLLEFMLDEAVASKLNKLTKPEVDALKVRLGILK